MKENTALFAGINYLSFIRDIWSILQKHRMLDESQGPGSSIPNSGFILLYQRNAHFTIRKTSSPTTFFSAWHNRVRFHKDILISALLEINSWHLSGWIYGSQGDQQEQQVCSLLVLQPTSLVPGNAFLGKKFPLERTLPQWNAARKGYSFPWLFQLYTECSVGRIQALLTLKGSRASHYFEVHLSALTGRVPKIAKV